VNEKYLDSIMHGATIKKNEWSYTSTPPDISSWHSHGQIQVYLNCSLIL